MVRWPWLVFCLLVSHAASGVEAVVSKTLFYAHEAGKKPAPYVEISFQLNPGSIHFYETAPKQWQSKVQTSIVIKKDEKELVHEDRFILQTPPLASYREATAQTIIDLHRYSVPAGHLSIEITFSEPGVEEHVFTYRDSMTVQEAPTTAYYSGIQLLDTAYDALQAQTVFRKNNRTQVPLSTNFLNDNRGIIHFYTELYQTTLAGKDHLPLVQRIFISRRPFDNALLKLQTTDTIQPAEVIPFLGQFDISALPSGNFYLNAMLENNQHEVVAQQNLFFQRSNKNPVIPKDTITDTATGMQKVNILDLSTTFLGKYSFGQIKAILKMMLPIATAQEARSINAFLDKPDETYMRYFIYNYWKSRNETEPKKPWDEYTSEVRVVNKLFGYGTRPGYETERGFIYLKYGKPTERVIVENEQGSQPYEIWQYNSLPRQGSGGVFLFYRPENMISDFRLLHSTVNGEMRNTAWRMDLYLNGSNPNARAEQYLTNR